MSDIWFIGDTHLGHTNIIKFLREDGTPLRPFTNVWEMEGYIFDKWCSVVKPTDKVYHLGDVAFTKQSLERMQGLPGHKRLIRGNHDGFKTSVYLKVFEEVYGVRQIDGYWLTHIPMHPGSLGKAKLNIHGHLHYKRLDDPRYLNVSVECIDYTPVNFDELKAKYK